MEIRFLYYLQTLHTDFLDSVMKGLSSIGNMGLIWIIASLIGLFIPKYRKCAAAMALSLIFAGITGNLILKNVVCRMRPCWVDSAISLLINNPKDYSFPSGHTFSSFSAATALFCFSKKAGAAAYVIAGSIAFSRMYLFVHYPTDILGGMLLGIISGIVSAGIIKKIFKVKYNNI